ncbi:MAG: hypothetical protein HQL52_08985 [Magnetococcales bacterium]|nr:hypothetical protein [Magnetococcales bacterium]
MKNDTQPALKKLEKLKTLPNVYDTILAQFNVGKMTDVGSLQGNQLARFQFVVDYYFEKFFPMELATPSGRVSRKWRFGSLFGF